MRRQALVIISILMILFPAGVMAACPEMVSLGSIASGCYNDFQPLSIAVDSSGNAYIADNYKDTMSKYNYKGQNVRTVSLTKPLSVAVDYLDRIYIGRADGSRGFYTGEVAVYDTNFGKLYSLGAGYGEFEYPIAIVTDRERIYVVDQKTSTVAVFDIVTGQKMFSFGGQGRTDGKLNLPNGIALNSATGNLYITDRKEYYDPNGKAYGPGAGGHIFSRDGAFLGGFITFSANQAAGSIDTPGGIAIDSLGRVYVTDFALGNIEIFDGAGAPLCGYKIADFTYPNGLVVGADGRMLVTARGTIFAYGVDDYVALEVTPSSLAFEVQQCGEVPSAKNITISNAGSGVLNWKLKANKTWIVSEALAGDINGSGSVNVGISVDPSALPGAEAGSVEVTAQGSRASVSISVSISPPPSLAVAPGSLAFSVEGSTMPPAQNLNVELSGDIGGSATWEAATSDAWLSLTPSSGPSGSVLVSVSINEAGLEGMGSGQYEGLISVSSACATGSPAEIPVTLTYVKGGTINVTSNIDEASYSISGPEAYSGSGASYTVKSVPEGTYTITFGAVSGYKAPASYSLDVVNGAVAEFVGNYTDLRERNNIIASMGGGQWFVPDELRIFDEAGTMYGSLEVASSSLDDTRKSKNGSSKVGMATAAGDIDGDGSDDIIVAHDRGVITGYKADGQFISGVNFRAFDFEADVDVAVADLNGDGLAEIIVGSGLKTADIPYIRVFGYSGGAVIDTGVNFIPYQSKSGVRVAAGDVDGDGLAEILTIQGSSSKDAMDVRVWKADASGGVGAWAVSDAGGFPLGISYSGGDITAGDLDADAIEEIIVSAVSKATENISTIAAFSAAGAKVLEYAVSSSASGVDIAAGDVDFDGAAEIVLGEGTHSGSTSTISVYEPDGTLKGDFKAFDDMDIYGVRVSLGRLAE